MRKILLSAILLFFYTTILSAQCYEYRVLNQDQGNIISEAKLTVCGNEVIYERIQKAERKKVASAVMHLYFENVRHYYNNATQEHIVQRILQDGTKLVSRFTSKQLPWVLSGGETRKIDGVACQKATLLDPKSDELITVWYAPEIPISFGPHSFHSRTVFLQGLPGLIMGISYGGTMTGFEILLADKKKMPERTLKPNWDGIEVPHTLIERDDPPKSEVNKYKKATK
ncbi:GLPGLI family protein [Rhodoflexus sp.]